MVAGEGPRHFIDLDHYQLDSLPRSWKAAVDKYSKTVSMRMASFLVVADDAIPAHKSIQGKSSLPLS